jgi:hypothetical protein
MDDYLWWSVAWGVLGLGILLWIWAIRFSIRSMAVDALFCWVLGFILLAAGWVALLL